MKTALAPTAGEVTELVRTAMAEGHMTVIIPTHATPVSAATPAALPPIPSSLSMTFRLPFDLAPAEARAFAPLLEHNHVSREALHAAITGTDDPATDIRGIDVFIHKMRKKLARRGITIKTLWGLGFTIDKATRDRVHRIVAKYNAGGVSATTPSTDQRKDITA